MSVEALNVVFDHSNSRGAARLVLLALAKFADEHGRCFCTHERLAEMANISVRSVTRAVETLFSLGELTILRRGDGRGQNSDYQICLDVIKVDKLSTFSGDEQSEKVDILSQKGDRMSTFEPEKGDNLSTFENEKVDILSQKGDKLSPFTPEKVDNLSTSKGKKKRKGDQKEEEKREEPSLPPKIPIDCPWPDSPQEEEVAAHPGTAVWLGLGFTWPGYRRMGLIADRLGRNPSAEALERAYEQWLLHGYRPGNYEGILEWYENYRRDPDWTPYRNGNGRHAEKPAETPAERVARIRRERKATGG